MRPKIIIEEGKYNKVVAVFINSKGRKVNVIKDENEILDMMKSYVGNSGVYLNPRNDSIKYATFDKFDVVIDKFVSRYHREFTDTIRQFYNTKKNIPMNIENPEFAFSNLDFEYSEYLDDKSRKEVLRKKEKLNNLVCFSLSTVLVIGAYVWEYHLDQEHEKDMMEKEKYSTEETYEYSNLNNYENDASIALNDVEEISYHR